MQSRTDRERSGPEIDELFAAWQRAEQRYRELATDSPNGELARAELDRLWDAYEKALGKAIGHGTLSDPPPDRRTR
jgi:hypothetical protein